jgi:hypothetical protein
VFAHVNLYLRIRFRLQSILAGNSPVEFLVPGQSLWRDSLAGQSLWRDEARASGTADQQKPPQPRACGCPCLHQSVEPLHVKTRFALSRMIWYFMSDTALSFCVMTPNERLNYCNVCLTLCLNQARIYLSMYVCVCVCKAMHVCNHKCNLNHIACDNATSLHSASFLLVYT